MCVCVFLYRTELGYDIMTADLTELKVQRLFWDEGWEDQKSCRGQVKVKEILE